jgi:hypothetical protein
VNDYSGTLIVLILLIVILFSVIVIAIFFNSLTKRKRAPMVVSVYDEAPQTISPTNYNSLIFKDADESRIQHILNRIREIERKIEIVKSQNISEEAKNITIQELEEEKRMLEEEIKKYFT